MSVSKSIFIQILIFSSLMFFSVKPILSQVGFEININSEEDELPTNFVRDGNGGYVGMVNKNWNGGDLYSISPTGDTTSVSITKDDTVMTFGKLITVKSENYSYLLQGHVSDSSGTFQHPFTIFFALDSNLNIVWNKSFKFNFYYSATFADIMQLKDSNMLFCCTPDFSQQMFLFEFSPDGDSLRYRLFTGDSAGLIISMTYNSDSSNILLHTEFAHYDPIGPQSQCITLDDNWNQIDVRYYPRWLRSPYTAILLPDTSILTGGVFRNAYNGIITAYKVKDDTAFDILRINKLSNADTNSQVAARGSVDYYYPGCYYIGGSIYLQGFEGFYPNWYYVAMLNDTLGVEYEKYIGGDAYYWLFSVTATTDGGVLLAGTRNEIGVQPFQRDVYIIKLDSLGCITGKDEKKSMALYDVLVYPNPGNKYLYVRTALKNCTLLLYNNNGVLIIKKPLINLVTLVSTNDLTTGYYIYKIMQNDEVVSTGKWIKN